MAERTRFYIVERRSPSMVLRLFSDGADAYRFVEGIKPARSIVISVITDASADHDGSRRPHRHYWSISSWTWEHYRWENREPAADCIPIRDQCPCGAKRPHVEGTPWPPHADSPMPDYAIVRAEAGPRPRASRARQVVPSTLGGGTDG